MQLYNFAKFIAFITILSANGAYITNLSKNDNKWNQTSLGTVHINKNTYSFDRVNENVQYSTQTFSVEEKI